MDPWIMWAPSLRKKGLCELFTKKTQEKAEGDLGGKTKFGEAPVKEPRGEKLPWGCDVDTQGPGKNGKGRNQDLRSSETSKLGAEPQREQGLQGSSF